jgi:hypothetical protein
MVRTVAILVEEVERLPELLDLLLGKLVHRSIFCVIDSTGAGEDGRRRRRSEGFQRLIVIFVLLPPNPLLFPFRPIASLFVLVRRVG